MENQRCFNKFVTKRNCAENKHTQNILTLVIRSRKDDHVGEVLVTTLQGLLAFVQTRQ